MMVAYTSQSPDSLSRKEQRSAGEGPTKRSRTAATRAAATMHVHTRASGAIETHRYFRAASKLRFIERCASATATTLAPCLLRRLGAGLPPAEEGAAAMLDTLKGVRTAEAGGTAARIAARAAILGKPLSNG